ncbi:MAG: hypothetical protein ACOX4Q_07330 [Syntrophomonadales bacterium]
MKTRWLALPLMALFLMMGVFPAVAVGENTLGKQFFDEKFASKRAAVEAALEQGTISKAQADRRLANHESRYNAIAAGNYECPAEGNAISQQCYGQGNCRTGKMGQGNGRGHGQGYGQGRGVRSSVAW